MPLRMRPATKPHSFRRGSRPSIVHHYLYVDGRLTGGIRRLKRMDKRKGLYHLPGPDITLASRSLCSPATFKTTFPKCTTAGPDLKIPDIVLFFTISN